MCAGWLGFLSACKFFFLVGSEGSRGDGGGGS